MSERRDFFKQMLAGSIAGLPAVKSVERLELNPEDTLVIACSGHPTHEQLNRVKELVQRELPGRKVLVHGPDVELKVLRG